MRLRLRRNLIRGETSSRPLLVWFYSVISEEVALIRCALKDGVLLYRSATVTRKKEHLVTVVCTT